MRKAENNRMAAEERKTYLRIEGASPGENVIYHVGSLMIDCERGKPMQVATVKGRRSGAWRCFQLGGCSLVQREVGDSKFEYIAQRR